MIKKIRFLDFLCFRDDEIEFDKGLNILIGPSGGGKTSVLEGILYGIFGFTSRSLKTSLKSLINENARSCKVILEIYLKGDLCRIERERTPLGQSKVILTIGGREIEGTIGDKFDKIAEVWGYSKRISRNSLIRAVLLSREGIDHPYPVELEESWIVDLAESIRERVLEKIKNLELKLSETKGKILSLEEVLKNLEKREALKLIDTEKMKLTRDILREKKSKIESEIGALSERARLLMESMEKGICLVCQRPLENLSFSLDSLIESLEKLKKEKENLEKDLLTLDKKIEESSVPGTIKEEKNKILNDLALLGEEMASISKDLNRFRIGKIKTENLKRVLLKFFLSGFIFPKANKYASLLFGEETRFRLEENVEIKIGSGSFKEFVLLSTGEKIRAGLSLKLATNYALSNLIRVPFLLIDEVLDSLDLENAGKLLKILIEERSQIILTSHRPIETLMSLVSSGNYFYINRGIKKL